MVGVHAAFTCTDDTLAAAAGLAEDLHVGAHIHVAEDPVDAGAGTRLSGLARPDWLLAHGVHLDRPLPGTLAHNPRSNMNNSVGYARPAAWPGPVALGSDGIGADMLEEFRLAYARSREADVTADPSQSWEWVATGWQTRPRSPRRPGPLVVRRGRRPVAAGFHPGRPCPRCLGRRGAGPGLWPADQSGRRRGPPESSRAGGPPLRPFVSSAGPVPTGHVHTGASLRGAASADSRHAIRLSAWLLSESSIDHAESGKTHREGQRPFGQLAGSLHERSAAAAGGAPSRSSFHAREQRERLLTAPTARGHRGVVSTMAEAATLRVNANRLVRRLQELGQIGALEGGGCCAPGADGRRPGGPGPGHHVDARRRPGRGHRRHWQRGRHSRRT